MSYGVADTASRSQGHSAPCSNRDFDFHYEGLEAGRLLVQQCVHCGTLRNPPGPACPSCQSFAWKALALRGTGTIFSWTVHFHPPLRGFEMPHSVALVEMDEGLRVVGAMDGVKTPLDIGMRVRTEFMRRGAVAGFRFVPAGD
jgi:uncharacterized OB-fold protein